MNTDRTDVTANIVDTIAAVADRRIQLSQFVEVIERWKADQTLRGKNAMVSSNHVSPEFQKTLRGRGGYLAVLSLAVRLEELLRTIPDTANTD